MLLQVVSSEPAMLAHTCARALRWRYYLRPDCLRVCACSVMIHDLILMTIAKEDRSILCASNTNIVYSMFSLVIVAYKRQAILAMKKKEVGRPAQRFKDGACKVLAQLSILTEVNLASLPPIRLDLNARIMPSSKHYLGSRLSSDSMRQRRDPCTRESMAKEMLRYAFGRLFDFYQPLSSALAQ